MEWEWAETVPEGLAAEGKVHDGREEVRSWIRVLTPATVKIEYEIRILKTRTAYMHGKNAYAPEKVALRTWALESAQDTL